MDSTPTSSQTGRVSSWRWDLLSVIETTLRPELGDTVSSLDVCSANETPSFDELIQRAFDIRTVTNGLFCFLVWLMCEEYLPAPLEPLEWTRTIDIRRLYKSIGLETAALVSRRTGTDQPERSALLPLLDECIREPAIELGIPVDLMFLIIHRFSVLASGQGYRFPSQALAKKLIAQNRLDDLAMKIALDRDFILPALHRYDARHPTGYTARLRQRVEAAALETQMRWFASSLAFPPADEGYGLMCVARARKFYESEPQPYLPTLELELKTGAVKLGNGRWATLRDKLRLAASRRGLPGLRRMTFADLKSARRVEGWNMKMVDTHRRNETF